jgi:hypothetical protein
MINSVYVSRPPAFLLTLIITLLFSFLVLKLLLYLERAIVFDLLGASRHSALASGSSKAE